ncbi:hypothetical protein KJ835_02825, partial [Patescibacteria group bacterium]|nr:hypothetical protein [Patescibacteria group bacterium]
EAFITRAIYDFNDKLMNVLGVFKHNIQGLHVVDRVASRKGVGGAGLNLTHQVRHGIISHDGESGKYSVEPNKIIVADYDKDIKRYLEKVIEKSGEIPFVPSDEIKNESDVVNEYRGKVLGVLKGASITPVTLEACIVFIMDVLSYLPQDFEDMVRMGVLRRDQIPLGIVAKLGDNIADMINNLITDVIIHSYEKNKIGYSEEMAEAVDCFKKFLYPNYYKVNSWAYAQGRDPRSQVPSGDIKRRMDFLFRRYHEALRDPLSHPNSSILGKFFTERKIKMYLDSVPEDKFRSSRTVVDYIAGFTDDYFFAESEDVNK